MASRMSAVHREGITLHGTSFNIFSTLLLIIGFHLSNKDLVKETISHSMNLFMQIIL